MIGCGTTDSGVSTAAAENSNDNSPRYTVREATVDKPDLYLVSSDRVAFPTRKAWLEAFSADCYEWSLDPALQEYSDSFGLDLPALEFANDAKVIEKLVGYINSASTGEVPQETDHGIAFSLLRLAQDRQMLVIVKLLSYQLMSPDAPQPTVIQSLEAYSYLEPIHHCKKLAAHYKSLILRNPAWASARLIEGPQLGQRPQQELWRFRVSGFEDGVIKTTEHDIQMPTLVACKLWHALYQQSAGVFCGGCSMGGAMSHVCGL